MGIDRKKFADNLTSERKRLGLKVNEMAEYCGVKPGSQYLYEKGDRLPNADYLDQAISIGAEPSSLLPSIAFTGTPRKDIKDIIEQVDEELSETRTTMIIDLLEAHQTKV